MNYRRQMTEIFLQVLQVTTAELLVGDNLDLALASLGDLDEVAEVSGTALDLDTVVEELLEGRSVEDLVVDGLGAVDDVLWFISYVRRLVRNSFSMSPALMKRQRTPE